MVVGEPAGALVAIFRTLVVGLAGLAPAFTFVVVVVDEAGDVFVGVLPDEIMLVVFAELFEVLLLAIVTESFPEPNEPPPELVANVITGAEFADTAKFEAIELESVGVDIAGITTGEILFDANCGATATHGGPLSQPLITNRPLT